MKIDQASLAYIQNVVRTAELVKIGNIIIEPDRVRAIDEDRTVVLFQDKNVPVMPFGAVGLNRIDVFSSRYELAKSNSGFSIDIVVEANDPANTFARSITMKADGMKIDYRCANPATIAAPKALNDAVKYKVKMTAEAVLNIQKGQSAMGADELTFVGNSDGVSFEMSDINSDKLEYKFADKVETVDGTEGEAKFIHKYPIKTLFPLFKANPDGYFYLTTRGMMKVVVNNLDIYVLPRT